MAAAAAGGGGSRSMGSIWKHRGARWIGLGWSGFILENLFLSENREEIIRLVGEDKYRLAYGSLSTLACSTIFAGWVKHGRGQGPHLIPLRVVRHPAVQVAAWALQTAGLLGASQLFPSIQNPFSLQGVGQQRPAALGDGPTLGPLQIRCPIDLQARDVPSGGGMARVTRHPQLWSMALIGLGASIGTPFASEAILFSFPTLWAAIGGAHIDRRHRRGSGGSLTKIDEDRTSHLPFLAFVRGKQDWREFKDELKGSNGTLALTLATLLALRRARRLHKLAAK